MSEQDIFALTDQAEIIRSSGLFTEPVKVSPEKFRSETQGAQFLYTPDLEPIVHKLRLESNDP